MLLVKIFLKKAAVWLKQLPAGAHTWQQLNDITPDGNLFVGLGIGAEQLTFLVIRALFGY